MKRIQSLEDFQRILDDLVIEGLTPEKVKFKFNLSQNLKKASKIQKGLIDILQMLTEMSDEIVALRLSYEKIDPNSDTVLNNMKGNVDNMIYTLKKVAESGKNTGLQDNNQRLMRNLERLKDGFLKRKSA